MEIQDIEINGKFRDALDLMEGTEKNIFITGRAGTGKSTLLEYFRKNTKKDVVAVAPTGVAALNINGQTIHSFFKFRPDITLDKVGCNSMYNSIYKNIDTIIIDEISMVRADLLDCVDKFMRLNGKSRNKPFGGAQVVFIGDLYQLPPVIRGNEKEIFKNNYESHYFFDSKSFKNLDIHFIELEKNYRQKDENFINLLNCIRNNTITNDQLSIINKRYSPEFAKNKNEFYIYLTTTNKVADGINQGELDKIKGDAFCSKAEILGEFDKNYISADIDLKVKVGAQIMLLNNDVSHRWVNGSVGEVIGISENKKYKKRIAIRLQNNKTVDVLPYTWEIFRFSYNAKTGSLDSKAIGSFTQYPLKLAWAITIHKSQGKTFDNIIIDFSGGTFSHGQVYVALSRCRTLDGIALLNPIEKRHILMDWRIVKFLTNFQYKLSEKEISFENKMKIINDAIESKSKLGIVYLKKSDEKSERIIEPKKVGEMEYLGKKYIGVESYCWKRKGNRIFRIDRILKIKKI